MFSLIECCALFLTIIVAYLFNLKWKSYYWQKKNIKSYPSKLIFGNFTPPTGRTKSLAAEFHELYKKAKNDNIDYLGVYTLLQSPLLMPISLDTVKLIMHEKFSHFMDRGTFVNERDDPLTGHLFSLGGQKWKTLRQKMTPTFTSIKMKQMFYTIAECGTLLETILSEKMKSSEGVDIKEVLGCYSTDIICSCAFGLEANTSTDPDSEFRKHGKSVFDLNAFRLLKRQFLSTYPNVAKFFRMKIFKREMTEFFLKIVDDTIKYRENSNYTRNDFLQIMIDMQKTDPTITLNTIAAQCFVFFVAGFETSSTTMTFALYELAKNQKLQDKARAEINRVLGKHEGKITYESMIDMKYLGQIIDETLRKWPAVPILSRKCTKTFKMPNEDVVIEEGTKILVPIMGIHLDEEYYPNPDEFDPERFNEENKKNIPEYAHMPFGAGPRVCIGLRFGVMQSKVGLTSVLKNYRVTLNSKTANPIKMKTASLIPTVEGGVWLNLEKL